jgi:hypothetical protein
MKKTLLSFFLLLGLGTTVLAQSSKTYLESLTVTINGNENKQDNAAVDVIQNGDGTIDLTLKNFMLIDTSDPEAVNIMPIGNIAVTKLTPKSIEGGKYSTFERNDTILIAAGDPAVSEMWMGPLLPPIPIVMKGQISDTNIYATLDIDMMQQLGQMIYVVVGEPIATDGVSLITKNPATNGVAVDLSGRRVKQQSRGIVLVDGKKVVRK